VLHVLISDKDVAQVVAALSQPSEEKK